MHYPPSFNHEIEVARRVPLTLRLKGLIMSITAIRPGHHPAPTTNDSKSRICSRCGIRYRPNPQHPQQTQCRDCQDLTLPIVDPQLFPPCRVCDRPTRPARTRYEDAPGTVARMGKNLCQSCARKGHHQ